MRRLNLLTHLFMFPATVVISILVPALVLILGLASSANAAVALLDAAETTTDLFAVENKIDLSKPNTEIYGYAAERHGDYARTRIFKMSERSMLDVKTYACEFSAVESQTPSEDFQTTCWKQKPSVPAFFAASEVRASVEDMQRSATEVARLMMKEKASEHADYTLLKVWPEKTGIQVQLGYESQAIEENYVCQTQPKLSCARASSVPGFEP